MNIKKEIIVNKPAKEVWEVLGDQFPDAYKWARGLDHSQGHGDPFDGTPCNNRTCEVPGFGKIQEAIRKFDSNKHILAYEVTHGFPGFIASAVNTWKLTPQGFNTKVEMNMEMQTKGIKGAIMGPMMKMNLSKTVAGVLSDLKTYVETGEPSEQKAKEIAKASMKAA
ncbi:MAG: SRPBCC family protein [Cyclobacteriaceae bacterium]|nr:SRPBCC family protein [Cyclobacteriaceae bacterium HetDA_MAG_MS6]